MKNVLVVYQNIPESTFTYLIKEVSGETLEILKDCNNRFINDESENESCDKLNYWLSNKEYYNEEWAAEVGLPQEECGKFADTKFDATTAIDATDIDLVIVTGFVL